MKRSTIFWILAFLMTTGTGIFQRLTGPTYPLSGSVQFEGSTLRYHFDRSFAGMSDAPVILSTEDPEIHAVLLWKRFSMEDEWIETAMEPDNGSLRALLPNQAPLEKIVYQVQVEKNGSTMLVPPDPVTMRFKGEVPLWVLIPHVLGMFGAMLFSLRAGFEYFTPEPVYTKLVTWTIGFLIVGGFLFGPLMSYYAFDLFWTGWPVGTDLTDNKTAIALLGWVIAAVGMKKSKSPGPWIIAAAIVMFVVFLIPHSI